MATSEIGRHVQSCHNQYYISTGHRLCPIIMKPSINDFQTKLLLLLNRLVVTANQTCWQSLAAMLKVVNINITYPQATIYVQSS